MKRIRGGKKVLFRDVRSENVGVYSKCEILAFIRLRFVFDSSSIHLFGYFKFVKGRVGLDCVVGKGWTGVLAVV